MMLLQLPQFLKNAVPLGRSESFHIVGPTLRSKDAEPYLLHLGPGAPEFRESIKIAASRQHLTSDRAVYCYRTSFNVAQDPLVGRRFPSLIVVRLQSIH